MKIRVLFMFSDRETRHLVASVIESLDPLLPTLFGEVQWRVRIEAGNQSARASSQIAVKIRAIKNKKEISREFLVRQHWPSMGVSDNRNEMMDWARGLALSK